MASTPCQIPCASNCACTSDEDCDDGNVCTDDYCESESTVAEGAGLVEYNTAGGCVHEPNTATCDDGIACTQSDTCSGGACSGTANNSLCGDGNTCTDDICTVGVGCSNPNNTALCDDLNPCTENDTCGAGTCTGTPRNCNDADDCTVDTCDGSGNCQHTRVDLDGDGVPDGCDEHPSIFDPTGCLYDEATGRVIPGGLVTPSGGPGTIHIGLTGASGCYQFSVTGLPADPNAALYTLSITLPPNCVRSTTCLADSNALDPTGQPEPYVLGPYEEAEGNIDPHDCASNPFYLSFELSDGDPTILNNNIPLACEFVPPAVPAPAMSPWAIAVALLLLLASAFVALRMRRTER